MSGDFFPKSLLTAYDHKGDDQCECDVRLVGRTISVKYRDHENIYVTYFGDDEGSRGHYNLRCKENGGTATLHRFPGDDTFIGDWLERGNVGLWKIELSRQDDQSSDW